MLKYVKSNRYKNEHMHYITKKYYANEQSFRDCIANNQVADLACLLACLLAAITYFKTIQGTMKYHRSLVICKNKCY